MNAIWPRRKSLVFILLTNLLGMYQGDALAEPQALYRLICHTAEHFYTTNCEERISVQTSTDKAPAPCEMELVSGYLETQKVPGSEVFHRLFNGPLVKHIYTASLGEVDALKRDGWIEEGHMGYISSTDGPGKTALYRTFQVNTGEHFYTINKVEFDSLQLPYIKENIAGYVWTTGTKCSGKDTPVYHECYPGPLQYYCFCGRTSAYLSNPTQCSDSECETRCKNAGTEGGACRIRGC